MWGYADTGWAGFFIEMAAKTPSKFILATKLGMTQLYGDKGILMPVTLLSVTPNVVTQVKSKDRDGYTATQVSAGTKKAKNLSKALRGHYKDLGSFRWSREFRGERELNVGDKLDVTTFAVGDVVRVSGISKGKGFAGAVKRHGFRGAPASHGHHHVLRHVGSIGQRFPQHTLKGSRGPGRDGGMRTSVRNLKVVAVDADLGVMALKGAVPGAIGTMVEVIA